MNEDTKEEVDKSSMIQDTHYFAQFFQNQTVQFNDLAVTLSNTLNDFGKNLCQHMEKVLVKNITPNASEDPKGNRPSTSAQSDEQPEDPKGNRLNLMPEDLNRKRHIASPQQNLRKKIRTEEANDSSEEDEVPDFQNEEDDKLSLFAGDNTDDDMHSIVNKAEVQAQHDTDQCDTDITVLLSEMTEDTEIGQPVDPKLAEALKKVWQKNIAKDRIKNSLKKQLTPSNCSFLSVPKVNQEIYTILPSQAKGKDIKNQKQEQYLVKAAIPITCILNKLMEAKINQPLTEELLISLKQSASEAIAILSYANSNLLQGRRDDIVPHLSKGYSQLRNVMSPDSEFLFGDDLSARIASITKSNKTINSAKKSYDGRTYYGNGKFDHKQRQSSYYKQSFSKNSKSFPRKTYPRGKQQYRGNQQYKGNQNSQQ